MTTKSRVSTNPLPGNIIIDASELDALPSGAVVLTTYDDVSYAYIKRLEDRLADLYGPWFHTGYEVSCSSDDVPLPARLIWHPEWLT